MFALIFRCALNDAVYQASVNKNPSQLDSREFNFVQTLTHSPIKLILYVKRIKCFFCQVFSSRGKESCKNLRTNAILANSVLINPFSISIWTLSSSALYQSKMITINLPKKKLHKRIILRICTIHSTQLSTKRKNPENYPNLLFDQKQEKIQLNDHDFPHIFCLFPAVIRKQNSIERNEVD